MPPLVFISSIGAGSRVEFGQGILLNNQRASLFASSPIMLVPRSVFTIGAVRSGATINALPATAIENHKLPVSVGADKPMTINVIDGSNDVARLCVYEIQKEKISDFAPRPRNSITAFDNRQFEASAMPIITTNLGGDNLKVVAKAAAQAVSDYQQ